MSTRVAAPEVSPERGDTVYRIHWKLGTDVLVGVCFCGAEHESEDPIELWEWLLGHPEHAKPSPVKRLAGVS